MSHINSLNRTLTPLVMCAAIYTIAESVSATATASQPCVVPPAGEAKERGRMEGAEGVAQVLVGKLGQLLSEEYRQLSSVRGEVARLRDEVAIMNALLRMLSEADDGAVDHFVREWMKQVRELAYDAEDCIDLFVRRVSYVPAGATALGVAWHLFATLRARRRLAADIQAFRARALAISERRARYGVDGQALRPSLSFGPGAAASSTQVLGAANDPNQLVGIKEQVERLSEKVKSMSDSQPNKKLKVFSIVGFGGLGKTTLATEVCRRLEEEFDCQATVSVSQAFDASKDMSGLLKRVLQQVVKVKRDLQKILEEEPLDNIGDDEHALATELSKRLLDKRYLIVIDDVWTISAWDKIRSKLPENNSSSRIMVTTRIETVAKACSQPSAWGDYIYRVKPLKSEHSKKLFVNKVFGPDDVCPTELQAPMGTILEKCGGLPLAVVSIASLLASYKSPGSVEMWERVCNSIGSQMESKPTLEGMRQVLTLSYNHLPHHLKACMMYLSIFPEDYVLRKGRLLNRWIAEGLVPEKRGLTSQEVAEDYFDELLSRNMIELCQLEDYFYYGSVTEGCRVHDMMLEVMVAKSLEANFASLVGGAQCGGRSYDTVRRLSIHGDDLGSGVEKMSMRHVRSLTTFRPKGQDKLLGRLAEFTLLRVLDLEGCKDVQDHHMKHVCRLFLLRFLNLNDTDITVMPSQIGELQHLQTLWLTGTLLDGVPESVINLEKLEHLHFRNRLHWSKLMRLPRGLRKMKALDGLTTLELREDDAELAKEIGDLVQLRELHIVLNCSNCSNGQVLKDLANSIGLLCSLRNFCVEDMRPDSNNMTFLHGLRSPPQLLRILMIGGTIDRLPGWVESLTHLVQIHFWWINIDGDQIYGVLYKLPNLLKIILGRKCCRDEELVARSTFKFQKLKELTFVHLKDGTPKVFRFEEGAMAKLERLTVRFYNEQRSIAGVDNLTSLKEVQLGGMKDNGALHKAVHQLKTESENRQESDRFKVVVKYE